MNREPIERMIAILKEVADENFYIGEYFVTNGKVTKAKINSCGSTACALGHAALDPWFIGRGLSVREFYRQTNIMQIVERIFNLPKAFLRELFGFNKNIAEFYGVEHRFVTPAMVINKLQKLLNLDN